LAKRTGPFPVLFFFFPEVSSRVFSEGAVLVTTFCSGPSDPVSTLTRVLFYAATTEGLLSFFS